MSKRHATALETPEALILRLEELVTAGSGANAFEVILGLITARLWATQSDQPFAASTVAALLQEADSAWPGVLSTQENRSPRPVLEDGHLAVCVEPLLNYQLATDGLWELDAMFEFLVSRTAKGSKGQFFTPRHAVELAIGMLDPAPGATVCDPACGSGGFLLASAAAGCTQLFGFDLDTRATRVARLLLRASGSPGQVHCLDSLRPGVLESSHPGLFDVIATNPPFAGDVREQALLSAYEVSGGRPVERDVLFVERCIKRLKPGGRMAMVLPHNKMGGARFEPLRRWVLERTCVRAVVGLGREMFLPHTHQKAAIILLENRPPDQRPILFALNERSGKDTAGKPVFTPGSSGRPWDRLDHDLGDILTGWREAGAWRS